jgi:hypothetical protein
MVVLLPIGAVELADAEARDDEDGGGVGVGGAEAIAGERELGFENSGEVDLTATGELEHASDH